MRAPRLSFIALAALLQMCLGASCEGGRKSDAQPTAPAAAAADDEQIEQLDGIDTSELTDAEVDVWTGLVNSQLSPCGDPVSVARCVAERRKCGACVMAARYLTRLVLEGYDRGTIEEQFKGRFDAKTRLDLQPGNSPVRGAPMAPITIVEFSDFQCPYCGAAAPQLERLLRENEGKLKLVFRHFPLSGHPRAMPAARAAEAAARQGKFWEMHDLLFEHQASLEDEDLIGYAQMAGLDLERFKADLASPEVQQRVDADRAEGERLGVEGTPTMFINGRRFSEPLKALDAYVEEEMQL